jgi:large subunit ribosomal protein L21
MNNELYAIANIAGDQVVLEPGKKIAVPKLDIEVGKSYTVDSILYLREGDVVKIGTPYIEGAKITAVVSEHKRLPKVVVFKKKRRKGYKVKRGHRQPYTVLEVQTAEVKAVKQPKTATGKKQPKSTTKE